MKLRLLLAVTIIALTVLAGCTYKYGKIHYQELPMQQISLGMTKDEVVGTIGHEPYSVVGAKKDSSGHIVEVWQYIKAKGDPINFNSDRDHFIEKNYYLFFYDGKLEKWTNLGDWERQATEILEVRLR